MAGIPNKKIPLVQIKKMKKIIGLCLVLITSLGTAFGQVSLDFCASVESTGACNFNNVKFITSPDSTKGKVFMEVKSTGVEPIGAAMVLFKIYKVSKTGEEKFETMLQQNIKPDWLYAWMPYTFDSPGKFNVKIYNESDKLLCSKTFELIAYTK